MILDILRQDGICFVKTSLERFVNEVGDKLKYCKKFVEGFSRNFLKGFFIKTHTLAMINK